MIDLVFLGLEVVGDGGLDERQLHFAAAAEELPDGIVKAAARELIDTHLCCD